jgi:hypothetical protein
MTHLPKATQEILRKLARSVALHRRGGGTLDDLPAAEQELLQAMDGLRRDFFMAELAEAGAEAAKSRLRDQLGKWHARHANGEPQKPVAEPNPDRDT